MPEAKETPLEKLRRLLLRVSHHTKYVAELVEQYQNEDYKDAVRDDNKDKAKSALKQVETDIDEIKSIVGKIL